jgi:ribosomal-protein-alanine N-acetyltransferase
MKVEFNPFPTILTPRLILRQIEESDCQDIFEMRSNPDMNEYTDSLPDTSKEVTLKYIANMNKGVQLNKWIIWSIVHKSNNKTIGTISIWNLNDQENKAELGYGIIPDYQNQGLMTEALDSILNYAFLYMELRIVEAYTEENNIKSRGFLLKNNFSFRGIISEKGYSVDKTFNMQIYQIKSDEYNYRFKAEIKKVPDIDGAYIEIPFDVVRIFQKSRVKVHATFDGVAYDGSIVKMQTPCHILGIRKEIRKQINKQANDNIDVTIKLRE